MRNTIDLITELDREAPKFFTISIAVGFERETKFVFANDPNRQRVLAELVQAGGEPVGLIGITQEPGLVSGYVVTGYTRPFEEFAGEPWVEEYLSQLTRTVGQLIQMDVKPGNGWVN